MELTAWIIKTSVSQTTFSTFSDQVPSKITLNRGYQEFSLGFRSLLPIDAVGELIKQDR